MDSAAVGQTRKTSTKVMLSEAKHLSWDSGCRIGT
jgi:hypothetical protein